MISFATMAVYRDLHILCVSMNLHDRATLICSVSIEVKLNQRPAKIQITAQWILYPFCTFMLNGANSLKSLRYFII